MKGVDVSARITLYAEGLSNPLVSTWRIWKRWNWQLWPSCGYRSMCSRYLLDATTRHQHVIRVHENALTEVSESIPLTRRRIMIPACHTLPPQESTWFSMSTLLLTVNILTVTSHGQPTLKLTCIALDNSRWYEGLTYSRSSKLSRVMITCWLCSLVTRLSMTTSLLPSLHDIRKLLSETWRIISQTTSRDQFPSATLPLTILT